ncbi:MAG: hypothetical protein H6832_10115 [Planctomycetes bacterium]|nr:hypothetical protein [Planctomycetota bacterium]MCB9891700.1 hypothetical protein [Planctomycetota bacterium]MCB9918743.1 hypothetical protein [Planctomycetota bacterium]
MCIGFLLILAGTCVAQDDTDNARVFRAWILDDKGCAASLEPLPSSDALRRVEIRDELWTRAARSGPRIGSLIAARIRGRDASDLALTGALGLCGGASASAAVIKALEPRRSVETRVFAALSAARAGIDVSAQALLQIAVDTRREQVLRYAARVALIARGHSRDLVEALARTREPAIEISFWRALCRASDARAPVLEQKLPAADGAGSFVVLARRALLLDAIQHPGVCDRDTLMQALDNAERGTMRRLASLALGRLGLEDASEARAWIDASPQLDISHFLAGLTELPQTLGSLLQRGPGGARDATTRGRFNAATARLAPTDVLEGFIERLAGLESEETTPAYRALLWRHLIIAPPFALSPGAVERLRASREAAASVLVACLDPRKGSRTAEAGEDRSVIGSVRVSTALAALSRGALGRDAVEGRALLWAVFADEYGEPLAGPGSWEAAFEAEFAALAFDLFVGAAESSAPQSAFLPDGIRLARKDYFTVLGELLRAYPIRPIVLPSR